VSGTNVVAASQSAGRRRLLHLVGAPLAFLLLAASPLPAASYAVRAGLGLLVWMSWWWIAEPVHLAVTGFLPVAVPAVFSFVRIDAILSSYAKPMVFLLLGANVLATLWRRWGLDRRIALVSLLGIGRSARRQIFAWFIAATLLSSVLPNPVAAATMMPIVIAMLRFAGIEAVGTSPFGSALLIAIAWGTAVGGSGTPLGGAPNLLMIQIVEQRIIDHEFLFTTWLTRVLPLTLVVTAVSIVFLRFAFRLDRDRFEGSPAYFAQELRALGTMSVPERWGLGLFTAATVLAFTRQLYASALPELTPAFAFLVLALASFAIRNRGEPLLDWTYAQTHMAWGLIYLFAGGSALGEILSDTGAARYLAERMVPLAGGGTFMAIVVFSLLTIAITQITNNTATIAIVVPITISTFERLGVNPVPFVYIVTVAGNCGLMSPSSSAGPAIAAGYGVDLKMMAGWGLWLTIVILIAIVAVGYLFVRFWPGFGVA